jgi:hypothetical protein
MPKRKRFKISDYPISTRAKMHNVRTGKIVQMDCIACQQPIYKGERYYHSDRYEWVCHVSHSEEVLNSDPQILVK